MIQLLIIRARDLSSDDRSITSLAANTRKNFVFEPIPVEYRLQSNIDDFLNCKAETIPEILPQILGAYFKPGASITSSSGVGQSIHGGLMEQGRQG